MKSINYEKLVVVGDIHGCADELNDLVNQCDTNSTFLFLGDLVDRGPKSREVVETVSRIVKDGSGFAVKGNHDESHVRYGRHLKRQMANSKYQIPMQFSEYKKRVYESLSEENVRFLDNLPYVLGFEFNNSSWVGVHAGLEPGKTLEEQDRGKMTHIRFVNKETKKTVSMLEGFRAPEGSVYWTSLHSSSVSVIYGHMVHSLSAPLVERQGLATLVGLDTGCCFGGVLSAAVFDKKATEISWIQVPARKKYYRF